MGGSNSSEIGGVRVFKVIAGSPAAEAGLEVFFDFIREINGVQMDPNGQQGFAKVIQDAENGAAKLQVFNTRSSNTREVIVNPRKWAGTGLLGATVRYDVVDPAENQGIRVLEVFPNSPAAHAGLVPFQDFLLGTSASVFHDIDELVEVVTANINQRMQVYVYNADAETVREVTIAPNNEWGGDGCIGCDIGTGLLHRIPAPRRMPGGMAPMNPMPGQQWAPPPAGLPQPAYPPGMAAGVPQMPVNPMMPVHPGVPQMPVYPGVPQMQVQPGVAHVQPAMPAYTMPAYAPQVPVPAPSVPGALHGISPTGQWQPQAPVPGYAPVMPGLAPGFAPGVVPQAMTAPAMAPPVPVPAYTVPAQAPAPAPVPVPLPAPVFPVYAPVPAPAPATAGLSQAEELAALQARIQQLGASSTAPAVGGPAVGGVKWPPQPQMAAQVGGVMWPPQPAPQDGLPHLPIPGSPGGFEGHAQMAASPVTPVAGAELPRAPPSTPMNAADALAPTDLSAALNPAAFAGAAQSPPTTPAGASALL